MNVRTKGSTVAEPIQEAVKMGSKGGGAEKKNLQLIIVSPYLDCFGMPRCCVVWWMELMPVNQGYVLPRWCSCCVFELENMVREICGFVVGPGSHTIPIGSGQDDQGRPCNVMYTWRNWSQSQWGGHGRSLDERRSITRLTLLEPLNGMFYFVWLNLAGFHSLKSINGIII